MSEIGELVGVGRTSMVYAYGVGSVIKVPKPGVPDEWVRAEATITKTIHGRHLAAPRVHDVASIDGRPAIVFERIDGISMWQTMHDDPASIHSLADELASIQQTIASSGPPDDLPDLVSRVERKLGQASRLTAEERSEAADRLHRLPRGAALLHGDLHPGNVLLSPNGPIVIDWFDACIGHPVADVVRTSLLLRPSPGTPRHDHLPGATRSMLESAHQKFIQARATSMPRIDDTAEHWQAVLAAGRLAEGDHVDHDALEQLWEQRTPIRTDQPRVR